LFIFTGCKGDAFQNTSKKTGSIKDASGKIGPHKMVQETTTHGVVTQSILGEMLVAHMRFLGGSEPIWATQNVVGPPPATTCLPIWFMNFSYITNNFHSTAARNCARTCQGDGLVEVLKGTLEVLSIH
jgi:hypothetical protein